MSKVRVYEFAKQYSLQSKDIIETCKSLNIPIGNHMSVLSEEEQEKVLQFFHKEKQIGQTNKEKTAAENQQDRGKKMETTTLNKTKESHKGKKKSVEKEFDEFQNKTKRRTLLSKEIEDEEEEVPAVKAPKKRRQKHRDKQTDYYDQEDTGKLMLTSDSMTVNELAQMIHKGTAEIIKKLMGLGIMATINQELDYETIEVLAAEFGIEVEKVVTIKEEDFEEIEENDAPEDLTLRPPVVTIMGHVDHGKTTLLDALRKSKIKVVMSEAGGITQHIGAYQIEVNDKPITFLDTPGHEAFTLMRARGAQITDITILVVAADDGVMPQTVEAISHAQAAGVPIIVAVNKMDKPEANPDRVKQELTEYNLVPEEWGGDTIFVPISALQGEGLDDLLEMVLLVAEVQELQANPNKRARGTVIEARLDKGRGPIATVLVQNGTLHVGDPIVVGSSFGRIRAMVNDLGRRVKDAAPSTPVEITGLNDVPSAGDQFMVFDDEKTARAIGEKRAQRKVESERRSTAKVSLEDLFKQIQEGDIKQINVIIKADTQGSAEALKGSLEKIEVEGVRVSIIHSGVGAITESDIILASASNALIIGFNVRPEPQARVAAEQEGVDIRLHRVIYKVTEEMEAAMKGMLDPEYEEEIIGQVEVRQTFKVSRVGTIAGCYVTEGKVTRDALARLIRDGIVVYEGKIDTLRRFKDDVKEVAQGYECGIVLDNYNDVKEGDIIEPYKMVEVTKK